MLPNLPVLLGCAFIPLIIAFGWYNPKVFGKTWQTTVGLSDEQMNTPPKWYQFLLSLLVYFLLAFGIFQLTIHQAHVTSLTGPDFEAMKTGTAAAFLAEYGRNFLTPTHGIVHGIFAWVIFAVPFVASPAIWERKGMKYFLVNGGYWLLTMIIMAVIIAKWGAVPIT